MYQQVHCTYIFYSNTLHIMHRIHCTYQHSSEHLSQIPKFDVYTMYMYIHVHTNVCIYIAIYTCSIITVGIHTVHACMYMHMYNVTKNSVDVLLTISVDVLLTCKSDDWSFGIFR